MVRKKLQKNMIIQHVTTITGYMDRHNVVTDSPKTKGEKE